MATKVGAANAAVANFARATPDALSSSYSAQAVERRLFVRQFDRDLMISYQLAVSTGDPQKAAAVERALRATLGGFVDNSPAQLAAMVPSSGGLDPNAFTMRDACLHLAMLSRMTGDASHADRAAAILARYAVVLPAWSVWTPYYEVPQKRTAMSQQDPAAFSSSFAAGLWGDWIYFDLVLATPLLQANAILAPTGATSRIGADSAIRRMFDLHVQTLRRFGAQPTYSNMDAFVIRGILDFGILLRDADLVHDGVNRLRNIYRTSFYADGWWHEQSTSYHLNLQDGLRWLVDDMPTDYSDPDGYVNSVDGTRFDTLDIRSVVQSPMARADDAMRRIVQPDGTILAVNESLWPQQTSSTLIPGMTPPTSSWLSGAIGQAGLVTGQGNTRTAATLGWGGTGGNHAHFDALNLGIFARGAEAISEGQYHPLPGSNSTREWHAMTAAHATVVVDETNQSASGRFGSRIRTPRPEDAIPGVPDWATRWTTSNANDAGELRFMSTEFAPVQVVEADASRAYDMATGVSTYQRTVALVKIDEVDAYVVDIFRVRGGNVHDYMLHSCLQLPYQVRTSLDLKAMGGSIHKYVTNLRGVTTSGSWRADFDLGNGSSMSSFVAGAQNTQVILGDAPSMRRTGSAPFLAVRRTGGDSVYAVVHHVHGVGDGRIVSVDSLDVSRPGCVALRVRLDSRTDTIVSCPDRSQPCTVEGGLEVRALFAHVAEAPTASSSWAFMVDGDQLSSQVGQLAGDTAFSGVVSATRRTEAGDAFNGFACGVVPSGTGSLAGSTMIVSHAGEVSWAYRISGVSGSTIVTPDEPGFRVDRGVVKQTYFPCWGFKGSATYRIPGYAAFFGTGSGSWSVAQSGSCVGSPGPMFVGNQVTLGQ